MSDLLGGVHEFAVAPSESATLGSETARGPGLLSHGHGLTCSPAAPFATLTTRSSLDMGSRLASAGLAIRIVRASGVVRDGLAMMLLVVIAMAAQGAHTAGALMICQTISYFRCDGPPRP